MRGRVRHPSPRRIGAAAVVALTAAVAALSLPAAGRGAVVDARAAGVTRASGRCGVCHPAERVRFESSRHASEDVHCTSCHGGNDQSLTLSVAHGAGFRGRIARRDVPKVCASCHSDETRMRPYNLPVDQYALYQTSVHGKKLAAGDTRVAVCSDCHGAHDILPASDPTSRVFPTNIPNTCGTCHGDSTLMIPRGRSDAYRNYLSSVHAHELLDRNNTRAPTCVSCHGAHGAAPPTVGNVDKVCGRCHTSERRYFDAGPHRVGMASQHLPECASCHKNHAIAAARPKRLTELCADCHGDKSRQAGIGIKIYTDYQTASDEIQQAAGLIVKADAVPLHTDDYRARIAEARTYLREALPAAHALDPAVVGDFTNRARSVAAEVQADIYGKLGQLRTRKFVLILFWFYVLLTVIILRRYRKAASERT